MVSLSLHFRSIRYLRNILIQRTACEKTQFLTVLPRFCRFRRCFVATRKKLNEKLQREYQHKSCVTSSVWKVDRKVKSSSSQAS